MADIKSTFGPGMAYVILGRIQDLSQLYLLNFDRDKVKANKDALTVAQKIRDMSLTNKSNNWSKEDAFTMKISTLNIRSLNKHHPDLIVDHVLMKSDIIVLTETFLLPPSDPPSISGYNCFTASYGRGSGVAIYVKSKIKIKAAKVVTNASFQLLKLCFQDFDLFGIYQSPKASIYGERSILDNLNEDKVTIVTGDININFLGNPRNTFSQYLKNHGFIQIIDCPTHEGGSCLDHFYLRPSEEQEVHHGFYIHPVYYSDHDALLVVLRKSIV